MYPLKTLTFNEFLNHHDLSANLSFDCRIHRMPLIDANFEVEKPYTNILRNDLKPEKPTKEEQKEKFIKKAKKQLTEFNDVVNNLNVHPIKNFFSSKYRKIVSDAHITFDKLRADTTDEMLETHFNTVYDKHKDFKEKEIRIVDQPFRVGDKIYAVCLNSTLLFDNIESFKAVDLREYIITNIRIDYLADSPYIIDDSNRPNVGVSFDLKINQEDQDCVYSNIHVKFNQNEENEYTMSAGYSNLRVYHSKEEAQSTYRSIVEQLKLKLNNI